MQDYASLHVVVIIWANLVNTHTHTRTQTNTQLLTGVCTTKHRSIPSRPLPVCLQCRLQTTSSLSQPRSYRSAWCLAIDFSGYGRRAFSVASPAIWNLLSESLRDPDISRDSFKRSLKTCLFSAYWCT